jgi:hypothetical protein
VAALRRLTPGHKCAKAGLTLEKFLLAGPIRAHTFFLPEPDGHKGENPMAAKKPAPTRARSAVTGQTVTPGFAKTHPTTTVVEKIKPKPPKPAKK